MRYLFVGCCLTIFLASSCRKLKDPVLKSVDNVKVNKLGLGTTVMAFDVHYFNPNNKKAILKHAEGEAWLDSNYVGHFHVDTTVNIPAKADFTVPVKLDVEMKFFVRYSLTGFRNEDVLITVNGKAKVGKCGFYKNIPLRYEGRQNLAQLIK